MTMIQSCNCFNHIIPPFVILGMSVPANAL
nr:MAG TPA: hypothetical protein [Caudoviricetes sp.]